MRFFFYHRSVLQKFSLRSQSVWTDRNQYRSCGGSACAVRNILQHPRVREVKTDRALSLDRNILANVNSWFSYFLLNVLCSTSSEKWVLAWGTILCRHITWRLSVSFRTKLLAKFILPRTYERRIFLFCKITRDEFFSNILTNLLLSRVKINDN